MAIKIKLKKLEIKIPFGALRSKIEEQGFKILPIEFTHTKIISRLPYHHKDPFDRMLIAQSMDNKIPIITHDTLFKKYKPKILW